MSLARSSLLFAAGTLLSRIAGLVRDRAVLSVFGSSELAEGFQIAFRIPNMLREMLAEGALGSAFTKVYSSLVVSDRERAGKLLWEGLFLATLLSALVCSLGIILAPWIVDAMTLNAEKVGHTPVLLHTASGLTRVLFPFLGFMVIGAVAMGALHAHGGFFVTSVSPIAFNVFNIVGALWFVDIARRDFPSCIGGSVAEPGITGFAIFVLLGGLAQTLWQVAALKIRLRESFGSCKWKFPWSDDLKKVALLMAPMALAASAGQINVFVNTIFATGAAPGAVVWLNAAFRLLHFPIGIFGVAIGAAVLPSLSRAMTRANGRVDGVASREIQNAFEFVLWLMTPCFAFYLVNSLDLVRFLFQSGRFTDADSVEAGAALFAYSFALIGYGLIKVLTSFYFALEKTKYALRVSLFGVLVNATVNYLFVREYGHVGLAFGYSVTLSVSVALLIFGLRGQGITLDAARFARSLGLLVAALVLAITAERTLSGHLGNLSWSDGSPVWLRSGVVLTVNGVATVLIFAGAGLLCLRMSPRGALQLLAKRRE